MNDYYGPAGRRADGTDDAAAFATTNAFASVQFSCTRETTERFGSAEDLEKCRESARRRRLRRIFNLSTFFRISARQACLNSFKSHSYFKRNYSITIIIYERFILDYLFTQIIQFVTCVFFINERWNVGDFW